MPKYMFTASYSVEGVKGLLADGGSKRRAVAQKAVESVGGKLEAFYYALGKHDVIGIADMPDNASIAALSLSISSTGAVRLQTTALLSPEEIDAAAKKAVKYTAPGR
jgi:uncharacterized protein with GYD domain